jgi:hypothetical protein
LQSGNYTTADGRWRLFLQIAQPRSSWKINAMAAGDARWLRRNGLLFERFDTRADALKSLAAWLDTAPDLPTEVPACVEKLRPLKRDPERKAWNVANAAVRLKRSGSDSATGGRGWVAMATDPATRDLFERTGAGTRVFSRLDEALGALAELLDDPKQIAATNERVKRRNQDQRYWEERMKDLNFGAREPAPLTPLLVRLSEQPAPMLA